MTMNNEPKYFQKKIKTTTKIIRDKIMSQKLIHHPKGLLDKRHGKLAKIKINDFLSKIRFIFG